MSKFTRDGFLKTVTAEEAGELNFNFSDDDCASPGKPFPNEDSKSIVVPPKYDPRTHVRDFKDYKFHPQSFYGNQGQLCMKFWIKAIEDKEDKQQSYIGSFSLIFLPTTKPLKNRHQFILSCAHNFEVNHKDSIKAAFHICHEKNGAHRLRNKQLIDYVKLHEDYKFEFNGDYDRYNDIAIAASYNGILNDITTKTTISNVEIAKPGNTICIIGYPGEYKGLLYYQVGTIHKLKYRTPDECLIFSKDIYITCGNSGSPVYLKKDDGTWTIIGIAVSSKCKGTTVCCVGLTKAKIDWLNKYAEFMIDNKNWTKRWLNPKNRN